MTNPNHPWKKGPLSGGQRVGEQIYLKLESFFANRRLRWKNPPPKISIFRLSLLRAPEVGPFFGFNGAADCVSGFFCPFCGRGKVICRGLNLVIQLHRHYPTQQSTLVLCHIHIRGLVVRLLNFISS